MKQLKFLISQTRNYLKDLIKKTDSLFNKNRIVQNHENYDEYVQALRLLEQKENQLHQNIRAIDEMRKIILTDYYK